MEYLKAALLAIVEGITEFLPISSTGHMILVEDVLALKGGPDFVATFMVVIQLPAILAVMVYFWPHLWPFAPTNDTEKTLWLWAKIVVAFLPAMVLGFLLGDLIEQWLFNPYTVAVALIVGGLVLIVIERRRHANHFPTVHHLSFKTAFLVGCIQCIAMVPGVSRSAATIIGALLLGASRAAAAEFSFFLAIPTMAGATAYTLMKHGLHFTLDQWQIVAVGCIMSFLVAYAVIAFLMRYLRNHDFTVFGWYRIALGGLVLAAFLLIK